MAGIVLASEIEAGRYICLRTGSAFGALIRLFTGSPFDHVILITGPGQCTQATVRGVKTGPLSQFAGALAVANSAEDMTAAQRDAVVKFALARDGDEYAWPLIGVLGLRRLGARWTWLLKISADKDALDCSELAASAGASAGLPAWLCGEPSAMLTEPGQMAARPVMVPVAWQP